jgi:putative ABC transport system ATP-binding protein
VARALSNEPAVIMADEPTGNLDSTNGQHVIDLLFDVHARRGTTLVLVTHDAALAARADVQLSLRDGRVVAPAAVPAAAVPV